MVCPSSLRLDLHLVLSCSIYFLWLWKSSSAGRWGSAIPGTYSSWVFVSLPLTGMMRERCLLLVQESLNHIIEPAEFLFDPFRLFGGRGIIQPVSFGGTFLDSCHSCCAASLASALKTSCTCSNRPGESLPCCLVGRCGKETVQRNVKFKDGRWDTSQGDDFKKQGSTYLKSHLRHDEHQPADLSTKGSNIRVRKGTPNGVGVS